MSFHIRRAYDPPSSDDGYRILVDRVWPRGVTKDALRIDEWMRDVAPSTRLRQWFGHDPDKWDEFQRRYFRELEAQPDAVRALRARARRGRVTLVYGARDPDHNQAVALRAFLTRRRGAARPKPGRAAR
jgi:uncharacterized protein YeaO (DUF488 family)